ncbi:MAG: hypothetical protein ACI4JN_06660 [Ruminococcus sp.]
MNINNCNKIKQYIHLLDRVDAGFSAKVAKSFEMGVSDFDIQYDIAQCVEYICNAPFDNIMKENMLDDNVGKKLHINGITKQIFKYVKSTLNYGRAKIDSSNILSECAGIIHAIEEGTASQRQVNKAFYNVFVDVDSEKKGNERNVPSEIFRNQSQGVYYDTIEKIKSVNSEYHEAYIPFIVADILKETYEKQNQKEEEENV